MVRTVLVTPTVKVFGLMHDFYASGPGYERLPLTCEKPTTIQRLDEVRLATLPGGTLVEWTR